MARKFTEYYYKEYKKIGDAAELISEIKEDDSKVKDKLEKYEGEIYCPDCKKAKL